MYEDPNVKWVIMRLWETWLWSIDAVSDLTSRQDPCHFIAVGNLYSSGIKQIRIIVHFVAQHNVSFIQGFIEWFSKYDKLCELFAAACNQISSKEHIYQDTK